MRSNFFLSLTAAFLLATPAFCSSLQDWEFNVNGKDYYPAAGNTFASVPGLNSSSYNSTTGLGTLTLTFDPGKAGTYYVGAWFFVPQATPFYNEYGAVNGSAASGQTWQIDIPEYDATSANHGNGTILDNLAAGTLNDTNTVPGTTTNYLHNCGADGGGAVTASCNDLVSLAQGFSFKLTATQEETVTFNLSSSSSTGFSIEDVHPIDGANTTASDLFYSGSAVLSCSKNCSPPPPPPPPPPTAPEPASWSLIATASGMLAFAFGRRRIARSK